LDDVSDLTINTLELWLTVQKMFKLITQSEKILPQELRMLIQRIHNEVHSPPPGTRHRRYHYAPLQYDILTSRVQVECKFSEEAVF
jgi:hypothetical protein